MAEAKEGGLVTPKVDYTGCVVRVVWDDAFDEKDVLPEDMRERTEWTSYGLVVRQNDYLITLAQSVGTDGGREMHTTNILWSMVLEVDVFATAREVENLVQIDL